MDEKERAPEDGIETPAATTPGGQPPEKAEDNPAVGQVKPEDYPDDAPDH
jgi:hypothetical protein